MRVAAANFAMGFELLLKREGNVVYTKEGTTESPVSKYRGFGVYSINKAGVWSKMYVTMCGKISKQLVSTFSASSQAPILG